jgi:hypothetical protein
MIIGVQITSHSPEPVHGLLASVERRRILGFCSFPMRRNGGRENRRKKRPEALEPEDTLLKGEDVPFILLTWICRVLYLRRAFRYGSGIELALSGVMVSHREEEVPEECELLLPGRLEVTVVEALNLVKGGVPLGREPLGTEFIIYAIMNLVHPAWEIQKGVHKGIFKGKWMLIIIICKRGTTEFTG